MIEWLAAGFIFGFLGSAHCVGMCGPIALALPTAGMVKLKKWLGILFYNLGRTIVYILLGTIVGFFGKMAGVIGFQKGLSILTGALLIGFALIPSLRKLVNKWQSIPSQNLDILIKPFKKLMQKKSIMSLFSIGLLNGFLPCGFVYMAIAAALNTGSTASSMVFMGGFGLGTMPAMFAVALSPGFLSPALRQKIQRWLPWATVALGLILVYRGIFKL
ncbi:MAG: sulfite exporter TauE/SafE family protein [Balneolaceae bacterium]